LQKSVTNLSDTPLTTAQINLLGRGLNFAPTPRQFNNIEFNEDVLKFNRNLRLKLHFHDKPSYQPTTIEPPKIHKSLWTPHKGANKHLDNACNMLSELAISQKPTRPSFSNLNHEEHEALKQLKLNQDIIIKPADKGSGVVVMNKSDYKSEALRQLNNKQHYELLIGDTTTLCNQKITEEIKSMQASGLLDAKTAKDLINPDPSTANLYLLPKIHKVNNPGRPIISANGCPTENISKYVDYFLQPLAQKCQSYIRDTGHFLHNISELPQLPPHSLLITADVTSLYTNIPHNEGIEAIKIALIKNQTDPNKIAVICRFLKLILTNNIFHFDNKFYRQVQGTAMGTKMAPSYAILFMAQLEEEFLEKQSKKPLVWWRYIDDIYMVWTHGLEELQKFQQNFDAFHQTIKLTWDISEEVANFLDTTTIIADGYLTTTLYTKPTDKHLYLFFNSCHPPHNKRGIPFSQALRIRRICSTDTEFNKHTELLKHYLIARGYKMQLIIDSIKKAKDYNRTDLIKPKERQGTQNKEVIIPLVTTYHPNSISNQLIQNFKQTLVLDPILKEVFQNKRMLIAYKHPPNLKAQLVRAKYQSQPFFKRSTLSGTKRCGKMCKTCPFIDSEKTININNVKHTIHGLYNCKSTNLIYIITCKKCPAFYIGETGRKLSDRGNDHRRGTINGENNQVPNHFNQEDHKLSDLKIKVLTQNTHKQASHRFKLERLWIYKLNALHTPGLNIKDW
jgi:hypothetical protein